MKFNRIKTFFGQLALFYSAMKALREDIDTDDKQYSGLLEEE